MGRLYHKRRWTKTANKYYKMAYKRDPKFADAFYYTGAIWHEWAPRCRNETYCYNEAVKFYKKAISQKAKPIYFNDLGVAYHLLKKYKKADRALSQAIKLDPELALAWHNRCLLRHDMLKHGPALVDCDRAIGLDPTNAEFWCTRGDIHFHIKDAKRASDDYKKALKIDPKYADAKLGLGLVLHHLQKDLGGAVRAYTAAININQKRARALYFYNRGLLYFEKELWEEAEADFTKAIKRDSKYWKALYHRGLARKKLGKNWEAAKDFRKLCDAAREDIDAKALCFRRQPPSPPPSPSPSPPPQPTPQP
jgi:tetratricopeptide (TPR) repeat protein